VSFRFVHAADLHLDTPFGGLEALEPGLATRLRDASLDALERIVQKAIEVRASFVVFAGDIYDGAERGVRAQLRFKEALARLGEHGIHSFVAHGNHDPEGGRWTAVREWPDGVTVFPPGAVATKTIAVEDGRSVTVHGISYGTRHTQENLARRFPAVTGDAGFHVAVLHCNVDSQEGHAPYSPCTLDDLRSQGMAYWALGHVHTHEVLNRQPWVVYPGNTQGRSIHSGERGVKGAVIVEVDAHGVREVRHFPTDTARFFEVDVSLTDVADFSAVVDRLVDEAARLRAENDGVLLLLRPRLTGRSEVYRDVRSVEQRSTLRISLEDRRLSDVAWLEPVNDAGPALDLERLKESDGLSAEIIATCEQWSQPGGWPGDDIFDKVQPPDEKERAALLESALNEVLERLEGEG